MRAGPNTGGRLRAGTAELLSESLPENASHIAPPAQLRHRDERDKPWQPVILEWILRWILGCASSRTAEASAAACADRVEHDPARDRARGHRSALAACVATTVSTDREAVYSRSRVSPTGRLGTRPWAGAARVCRPGVRSLRPCGFCSSVPIARYRATVLRPHECPAHRAVGRRVRAARCGFNRYRGGGECRPSRSRSCASSARADWKRRP
jgi:hypothetical protein